MPHGDIARARRLIADHGLDALLTFIPDNCWYLSGYQAAQAMMGLVCIVLPADPALVPAMTVSRSVETWARFHTFIEDIRPIQVWIEIDERAELEAGTTARVEKPVQFDQDSVLDTIAGILKERNLGEARIGCELGRLPHRLVTKIKLALHGVELVDATDLLWMLRAVKSPDEIAAVREAARLAEVGLKAVALDSNPRGRTISQLRLEYYIAIMAAVRNDAGVCGFQAAWAYISAGGDVSSTIGRNETAVREGDVLWIDCDVTVDGYASDIGRSFSLGKAAPLTSRVFAALEAGHQVGLSALRPGVSLGAVFAATQETIRRNGLPTYTRGHLGHAIGVGPGEQPPFIAAGEQTRLEPGMVLALETPYYVRGLGGFQLESDVLVTESGIEILSRLPARFLVI